MMTPLIYIMFKLGIENKQYEIRFEVTTSSQTKLQLPSCISLKTFTLFNYLKIKIKIIKIITI